MAISPTCPICFGIGWVCENHPKRVWSEELGCQCGAGMPCECNRTDGLREPDVSTVLVEIPTFAPPLVEPRLKVEVQRLTDPVAAANGKSAGALMLAPVCRALDLAYCNDVLRLRAGLTLNRHRVRAANRGLGTFPSKDGLE